VADTWRERVGNAARLPWAQRKLIDTPATVDFERGRE